MGIFKKGRLGVESLSEQKNENILHGKLLKEDSGFEDPARGILEFYLYWGDKKIFTGSNHDEPKKLITILMEKNINPSELSHSEIVKLLDEQEK